MLKLRHSRIWLHAYCPMKEYLFYLTRDDTIELVTGPMIIGTAIHKMFAACVDNGEAMPFDEAMYSSIENMGNVNINFDPKEVNTWIDKANDPDTFYGLNLLQIVEGCVTGVVSMLDDVSVEVPLSRVVDDVEFTGTADIIGKFRGATAIFDVKTAGLANRLIYGKPIRGQSMTEDMVREHRQLKHYAWLLGLKPDSIFRAGIVLPANAVPYDSGKDRGKPRGPLCVSAGSTPGFIGDDILSLADSIKRGTRIRNRPLTMGNPDCATCPALKPCSTNSVERIEDINLDYWEP